MLADFPVAGFPSPPPPDPPLLPALLGVFEIFSLSLFVSLPIAEPLRLVVTPSPFGEGN